MNENYLLDTDILISYLRGYPDTINLLKSLARNGATFSISVITVVEVEAGIRAGENRIRDRRSAPGGPYS